MKPRAFFSSAIAVLLLVAAVYLPAAEVPAIKAFGDTAALPTEKRAREALETMLPPLNMDGEVTDYDSPAASGGAAQSAQLPPEVLAQLKPMYEKSIADLEAQLAKLDPVKDRDQRQMLEPALASAKQNYAQMFGGAPAAAPVAPKAGKPVLRRPVIGNRIPSFAEAMKNLKKMLGDNVSAAALAAFAADPAYQDANRSAAAAAGAAMVHRPLAAVAALLRANELEPKKPAHLVNLAGVVTNLGMPRHALALLAEAEKLGQPLPGAFGLNGRAVLLSNRGHALIQVKRFAEAETVLREAARLAPVLGEARANLALALYAQNDPKKKEEAVQLLRFAGRRVAAQKPTAPAPTTPPATTPTNPAPGGPAESDSDAAEAGAADSSGRPAPELVLDMSRPKSGGLPTIKIPRTIIDGAAMWPKVEKLSKETSARLETITQRMIALDKLMRQRERSGDISPATAHRARDIFWYIGNTPHVSRFRGLWREVQKACADPGSGLTGGQIDNPWGSLELMKKQDEIYARSQRYPVTAAQMWAATEPYHSSWQGPIHWIESATNQYFHQTYPYMTAIAANLYEPMYHEYAMLLIENMAISLTHDLVAPLYTVTKHDYYFVKAWGTNGGEGSAEDPTPGNYPEADSCPAHLRGEYKVKFDVEIVGFSINCEKVSVEGSLGEWLKLFGEVEVTFTGDTTIFVGGAAEGEVPIVGGVEAGAKAGAYLTFNSKGEIIDGGLKATESSGVSVGPVGYEREIEHTYSFAAAFSDGLQ